MIQDARDTKEPETYESREILGQAMICMGEKVVSRHSIRNLEMM